MPGFEQAVAAYQARKDSGHLAVALAGSSSSGKKSGGLLAALFGGGGGADDEEDSSPIMAAAPAPKAAVKKAAPARKPEPGIQILSPEEAQRADIPQIAEADDAPEQTPETIIAALPARSVPLPVLAPRPEAEVGPTTVAALAEEPESMPFGMAEPPLDEAAAEVALNIPLPTRRPDYSPPKELATPGEQDAILLALADDSQDDKPAIAAAASLPLPEGRPETLDRDMVVAALPDKSAILPESAKPDHLSKAAVVQAEVEAGSERVAALASITATPRDTVVQRVSDKPAAATGQGVKTTRKTARASAEDSRPDRKPVVVAAQPQAARWVLHTDYVKNASAGTRAPSFAYNLVRTAPREVYTAGFQAENQARDANRFSGKAVEFLSVARF